MTRGPRHVYQLPPTSQEHVRRGQVAAVAAQLAAVLPRVRRDLRHQGGQRVGRVPLPLLQTVTCCFSALISYAQFIRPTLIHKSLFSHQLETWEGKQSQSKENSSEITLIKYSATIRRPHNHSPRPVALLLPEVQTMTDFLLVLLLTASSCLMLEKDSLSSGSLVNY